MVNNDMPAIISVKQLLQENSLKIPDYQRPYKWTTKNVNQLIDDIISHNEKSAYRLGTLVIHRNMENDKEVFNIVDGQQRTLTLTLIAYAITQHCQTDLKRIFSRDEEIDQYRPKLLSLSFSNDTTKTNIQDNYREIERRIKEFDEKTIFFFFNKCELVKVVLADISEAFQFFDSQNARGKDLEPHDLLKAFHLREMNKHSTEAERRETVERWETMDTDKLSGLFTLYLYRIRNWSKGYSARYFTKNDVDVFKGVSPDIQENYPFAEIYRMVHCYIEKYKHSGNIDKKELVYPFQIDQPIINGKRFFEMVAYYDKLVDDIKNNNIENIKNNKILKTISNYKGRNRTGDKYVRNLFYCGLVYYVDRFGKKDLQKAIDKIFVWAYSLRLKLSRVGLDSIDNYSLNKAHSQIQLFNQIREAVNHNDILNMKFDIVKENNSTKTESIVNLFKEMKYYE
ncbi:MAG: DUF262 domain-containing protein [Bacteroidales bacterium]|jgi:hypothetical protein|nr:DUF262 domain-containing protein [Bacteroidales bacterium]